MGVGGISSSFSGELGVLQVGMSKFVQHTNHLPEKNLINSFRGPYHSSSKLAILSSRHLREDKLAILSTRHLGEDSVLKKKNLVCWWGWDIKFFFRRVGGLTNWDVQVCSTYQPGVLQVGMSKFVPHTNHLPEKKLDKL